jgi:hypothetical protein
LFARYRLIYPYQLLIMHVALTLAVWRCFLLPPAQLS